ncbi:hypothetical protein VDGE_30741 [Verticillium dahliae]|uniref:Uncharacterized protein n=1 Tax=Verticillium dahliae TaxID=27337 RepID=A0A444RJC5_VERDA|nr:hypothetical protein VDGE_30741 [Verticillium dahliae]
MGDYCAVKTKCGEESCLLDPVDPDIQGIGVILSMLHWRSGASQSPFIKKPGCLLETRVNTLTTEEGNPASTPRYQSVVEAAREKRKVAFCIALLVSVIHFVGVLLFTYFCFPYSAFAFAGFLLLSYV